MADKNAKESQEGITMKKSVDFMEWYNQACLKGELAEYSQVSGCMVVKPAGYSLWESIQHFLDTRFKARGVKNAYFPLLIPENLLTKEQEHVEGFTPEVAWVTMSGKTKLEERLAIRPTSETIMYDTFSRWIRSWRDLPLLINQWCNVVRWEFNNPRLFLRTREFLWQEGHTCYADKKDAEKEVYDILDIYAAAYEQLLAVPVTKGMKTEKEKFAGAEFTTTVEAMMPDGRVIQGATSHHLGQHFAKPFNIQYLDQEGTLKHVWQNSWGFTTRSIGVLVSIHGDDKGLVLPPHVAPTQAVIIPIYKEESKALVLKEADKLCTALLKEGVRAEVDSRDNYTPGWKFNEHELKGTPLRIEIGPKDIEKHQAMFAVRHSGEKFPVLLTDVAKKAHETMEKIHTEMFTKAKKMADELTFHAKNYAELKKGVEHGRVLAGWCQSRECEDKVKEETSAKISCLPFDQHKVDAHCAVCGEKAKKMAYFARSY